MYIYVLYITAQRQPIYRTKLYVDTFDQQ